MLWFLPLLLVEIPPFIFGWQSGLTPSIISSVLLMMFIVGLTEELFFRGLILHTLGVKALRFSVIVSSLLFSLGHLSNLAGGAALGLTLLQVLFAFLFGLVAAEIVLQTKSLLVPTVWHFLHNSISSLTGAADDTKGLLLVAAQCFVLLVYGLYLGQKRRKRQDA